MEHPIRKKTMHPFVQFFIELLSARAGLYIPQKKKETDRA